MDLIRQDSPDVRDLQAEIESLKARLRTVEDENQQLRRRHGTSFPLMDLPLELRMLVWEHALPDRRVLRIAELPTGEIYGAGATFFCSAAPPVLLHICRESREFALTHFKPFFEKIFESKKMSRPIYFRPKLDILYFDSDILSSQIALGYPEVNDIESIAIRHDRNGPKRLWNYGYHGAIGTSCLTGMTRLLLVEALEWPWPSNRCCATIELSPDPAGKQKELEWTDFIARDRHSDHYVPNIQHVEAVLGKFFQNNSYLN
ncbi:hypothetical protein B0T10DRAFT_404043 [Thelonectria olida]|uniref:2EXR domain-containing protein n=1 Tax=Thelonectria olida TaxID=1576542 RepID=A0A9P8W4I0_9HYPO|nr:hypothetical protein B0T10DRAFT_404043 [Thelonectria olida]